MTDGIVLSYARIVPFKYRQHRLPFMPNWSEFTRFRETGASTCHGCCAHMKSDLLREPATRDQCAGAGRESWKANRRAMEGSAQDERLSASARDIIVDDVNDILVSKHRICLGR